jgi:uncharacterized protein (DUF1684 family)
LVPDPVVIPGAVSTDDPRATLDLWDYRRRVSENYRAVREGGPGEQTWLAWRQARQRLFAEHPQSAIEAEDRAEWGGLAYFPHDPAWRFEVEVEPVAGEAMAIGHSGAGQTGFRTFGRARFEAQGSEAVVTLYWLEGYGGGIFLPFRDATSGHETYGGGRYLLDTAKGADLGHSGERLVLDFNYAYHPSCVYSPRWSCPLAPRENWLSVVVRAGERLP